MTRIICSVVFIILLILPLLRIDVASAQQTAKSDISSSITGRVIGEGGQPVANAPVFVMPANSRSDQSSTLASTLRPVTTDNDGRFEAKDLRRGAYSVTAFLPGYITSGNPQQAYYRPGDSVTISMVKGGVITGKVTNATGDPISGIRVRATRIKDSDNRAVRIDLASMTSPAASSSLQWEWITDDRGIYRIYGLEPGIYTVAAGGRGLTPAQKGGYDGDAPTYHPSGNADTAAEVIVRAGVDTTNVDIRYRESRGLVISGSISGSASSFVVTMIMRASTGLPERMSIALPTSSGRSFLFDSVADGDYYLYAFSSMGAGDGETFASKPRRVSVKGADVTGIDLQLAPLGSVAGRIVIEPAARADCKPARAGSFEEVVIRAQSDRKEKLRDEPDSLLSVYATTSPNEKGEFQIRYLDQGVKRLAVQLPGEDYFIRSISMPATAPNAKPKDSARDGINIKSGDKVTSVTVALSEGAATLSGRVTIPKDTSAPFSRMKVYLVPAEADASDSLLRYYEARIEGDGVFKLASLAPGRYWIVARPLMEEESVENAERPKAWDAADRMGLRFEGEASATVVELKQCERIAGYILKFTPPATVRPRR